METIDFFLIESSNEKQLFEIEIFCDIINVFTVIFYHLYIVYIALLEKQNHF